MTDMETRRTTMPFALETELERSICRDQEWIQGAEWGVPRPGHPEGAVKHHIAEVLANIDRYASDPDQRTGLRLIALTHDTFKHLVDPGKPKQGENHHGMIARRFSERYLDDSRVLEIIELHDEAYNAWASGERKRKWEHAEARARALIDRLGPDLGVYLTFFRCDNETGTKDQASVVWFEALSAEREQ